MSNSALLPLAVDRWVSAYRTVRLVGIDANGSSSRIEVRPSGDVPGAPLLRLDSTTAAGAPGIRLVGVAIENGGPVSTFELVIGDAALAALPFSGALGVATELAYDWVITIAGRKRVLAGGPFVVLPGVTGADASPAQRSSAFVDPAAPDRTWDTAELTFAGGEIIEVSINGVALLVPYVVAARAAAIEAVSARDEAVNAARTTRADRASTGADRIATGVDRTQAGIERQQAQAASAATIDAIARAGGSVVLPIAFPALTIAAMRAAAIPANGTLAQLLDPARAGLFRYDSSDLSAVVAIDTDAALYVAPAARPNGTLGAWVRVRGDEVQATWSGVGPNTENAEAALNRLLALMSPGDWLVLPPYEMGIQGKVTLPLGVNIRGGGKMISGLLARTDGKKNFHGIHFKFGSNIAQGFYCGGMKGQLTVGEAAAFHAYPAEVQTGVPLPPAPTADVTNVTLVDLRATDCETGFRMGYNVTAIDGSGTLFRTRGASMTDCDSDGILSHNIELFASHDIVIRGGRHVMVDGTAADPQKMLRLIGCRRVKVSDATFTGPGTSTLFRAVYVEMAAPYSKARYWQFPADIELRNVSVTGCPAPLYINSLQGAFKWDGGIVRGVSAILTTAFRLASIGYVIEPQVVRGTPPGSGETGIKLSITRCEVSNVQTFDCHEVIRVAGKVDLAAFTDIENYGPAAGIAGRYAINADEGSADLDVYRLVIDNVRDYAPRTIGYCASIVGGRLGSTIDIDRCAMSMTKVADRSPFRLSNAAAQNNVAIRSPSTGPVRRVEPSLYTGMTAGIIEKDAA